MKLLTPILPHTTDEIWAYFEHVNEESVQLTDMPEAQDFGDEAIRTSRTIRNAYAYS